MRPETIKTKIFLDSGDPAETREILSTLGFLDGQTTNPSLIAKNPKTVGRKFSQDELLKFYRGVVEEVSSQIPQGSVSIEVYADLATTADEMFRQGKEYYKWIPNACIKYPTIKEGLKAAEMSVKEGMRVNMTLVFSQEQAAAVYAATMGAQKGQVFISPFVGRLDDIGQKGMDLIANIIKMYAQGDGHVEVLTASIRSAHQISEAIGLGSDILTAPVKVLLAWNEKNQKNQQTSIEQSINSNLKSIPYQPINLNQSWQEYNLEHERTSKGLEKFAQDWNELITS